MNGAWFTFHFQDFSYSFLSILFEGIPFLLLGSLLSGAIDAFVPAEVFSRFLPGNNIAAIALSGMLGAIFPMCECGSVVVTRRFIRKGLPIASAVTYMLSAPIVNPVVALSTFAAFRGQSPWVMMSLRLMLGFVLAVTVGFIVQQAPMGKILQQSIVDSVPGARRRTAFRMSAAPREEGGDLNIRLEGGGWRFKILAAVQSATSDFLDVAFFLVVGAAITSVFNTAVNQQVIQPLATNPLLATVAMMVLRFMLALCSTSDAFIAASFVSFPFVAKLAFLVFGAMFDIKLFFLYGIIFKRWFILALGIGLFVAVAVLCLRLTVLNL